MFDSIRKSKLSKVVACYMAVQLVGTIVAPTAAYALTSGPSQPEFNSFTPIGTSDMVNLSSGDFNYNIPIMDVGGYPLNLAYDSGVTMDQEASWVGLGWNLNVGQIARNVRGIPDDFNGDLINYENDIKEISTVGGSVNVPASLFGWDALSLRVGLGVEYNSQTGYTAQPFIGPSFSFGKFSLGVDISPSVDNGPSIRPNIALRHQVSGGNEQSTLYKMNSGVGLGFNSRQGLQNFNMSFSMDRLDRLKNTGTSISSRGGITFNDQSYTPPRRFGTSTKNFTFNVSGGATVFGVQLQGQGTGFGTYQNIKDSDKNIMEAAFGYEHTEEAHTIGGQGVIDVNRENDKVVNKYTNVLSVPQVTYDMYAIQSQGISGSFRPHRGQVGHIYDGIVQDDSDSDTFGIEFGGGLLTYSGFEVKLTDMVSSSSRWKSKNSALKRFDENVNDDDVIDYERVFYKSYGDFNVDPDTQLFEDELLGSTAVRLGIEGGKYNRKLIPVLEPAENSGPGLSNKTINTKIKRNERRLRNQAIVSVTNGDAIYDPLVIHRDTDFAKLHHTAGMKVLKPDGSTYVFGESAYNLKKVEASFDVSKRINTADCNLGLISYNPNFESNHTSRSDGFFNRVTTPAYAHTYLLSSVLSSDYEDITGDGPSIDDLGSYTLFKYRSPENTFNWRIPFESNKASYNEGLKSNMNDEKASYIYGEKEIKYIQTIETKTHVALFKLSDRNDGRGVQGEHGGMASSNNGVQKKIDKIYLFSKPEFKRSWIEDLESDDPADVPSEETLMKASIKIAHFKYAKYDENGVYDSSMEGTELCAGVPNTTEPGGKLTLEKVYFTYRDSYMGKYTPYVFEYADFDRDGNGEQEANPDYNSKAYDIWGSYKPNKSLSCNTTSRLSTLEFPFVDQNKEKTDTYTRSWSLSKIYLPSGGDIEVDFESDDYQYVQERRAMNMLKVVGTGNESGENGEIPDDFNLKSFGAQALYDDDGHYQYLYVKLSDTPLEYTNAEFIETYLNNKTSDPIYFRFLVNMDKEVSKYDYVEGYFLLDDTNLESSINIFQTGAAGSTFVALPMKFLDLEGIANNTSVNPISKAGWYFGRKYLNRLVYGKDETEDTQNFEEIMESLIASIQNLAEIFESPNGILEQNNISSKFIAHKSWIRLYNESKAKLGGGSRVQEIRMSDRWDIMTGQAGQAGQFYGQNYDYTDDDGNSSGVASFEPNSSKENPYVEPFFNESGTGYKDKIVSPKESNYVERPIAGAFYPSPSITYGKVTVSNLSRTRDDVVLKRKATGKVITKHFTSRDFPTKTSFTSLNIKRDKPTALSQLFQFSVKNHLTLSQGFAVETNDMAGKMRSQEVYAEDALTPISGTEYIYKTASDSNSSLDNYLPTINEQGQIENRLIGVDYEMVNDFRQNKTNIETGGVNTNVTSFSLGFIPWVVPLPLPTVAKQETLLRSASTIKHIHRAGIMIEKKAFDLGSNVSTHNIAWDDKTGEVLLTRTINEYDDNYFNFNYPVHWNKAYSGMGMATQNIGLQGILESGASPGLFNLTSMTNSAPLPANNYLAEEDQILIEGDDPDFQDGIYWVAGFNGTRVMIMDREGKILYECEDEEEAGPFTFKVIRSGYKNQHTASMASVTSMVNPFDTNGDGNFNNLNTNSLKFNLPKYIGADPKIISASAVSYKGQWLPQRESKIIPFYIQAGGFIDNRYQHANPYIFNIKNEWRADRSLTYLTGRRFIEEVPTPGASPRREGFFTSFNPYYELNGSNWQVNPSNWTFASAVTKYSPYGAELENKDALNRYSSAQYGFNYTLPTAVASNTKYRELGFDGFEDYSYGNRGSAGGRNGTDHFSFADERSKDGIRSRVTSHTGQYSFRVSGENNAVGITYSLVEQQVEPRETCIDDEEPPEEYDLCNRDLDKPFTICNQQDQIELPSAFFDFGPSGPASDPLDWGEEAENSFPDFNVLLNPDELRVFINLNTCGCKIQAGANILDINITFRNNDGQQETCRYRFPIVNNGNDCGETDNDSSQCESLCPEGGSNVITNPSN